MSPSKPVQIINKRNEAILANEVHSANTPLTRLKGLLGRNGLKEGEGLIIDPCSSIHTFFMRFSIDAVFVDKNNKIVSIAENLQPWRLFGTLFKGKKVIELPAGTVKKTMTKQGDYLEIIFHEI